MSPSIVLTNIYEGLVQCGPRASVMTSRMSLVQRSARLSSFLVLATLCIAQSFNTDVVIVSNNDLNPSNPNRASALLLKTPMTCEEAQKTCGDLQESLLPAPITTGLTAANLTSVLTSDRHGAALPPSQNLWIAGNSRC